MHPPLETFLRYYVVPAVIVSAVWMMLDLTWKLATAVALAGCR